MIDERLNYHRTFSANKKGQDFFVGDIHGHYDLLIKTLDEVGFDDKKGDRLFSVGDIINRGPDSDKCIQLLIKPWFFAVLGNHEDLLLSIINNPDPQTLETLRKIGGEWVSELLNTSHKKLKLLISIVYARMFLAFTIKTSHGNIGVIHANAPDNWKDIAQRQLSEKEENSCLWSAKRYYDKATIPVKNIDAVVSGHINCSDVKKHANHLWIDTLRSSEKLTILSAEQVFKAINND